MKINNKMNLKINKDIKSYIHDLTDLVWNFIRNRAIYPANAVLAVRRELACNVFDSPDNCQECDFYARSAHHPQRQRLRRSQLCHDQKYRQAVLLTDTTKKSWSRQHFHRIIRNFDPIIQPNDYNYD